jgi:hypothetical protein
VIVPLTMAAHPSQHMSGPASLDFEPTYCAGIYQQIMMVEWALAWDTLDQPLKAKFVRQQFVAQNPYLPPDFVPQGDNNTRFKLFKKWVRNLHCGRKQCLEYIRFVRRELCTSSAETDHCLRQFSPIAFLNALWTDEFLSRHGRADVHRVFEALRNGSKTVSASIFGDPNSHPVDLLAVRMAACERCSSQSLVFLAKRSARSLQSALYTGIRENGCGRTGLSTWLLYYR